MKTATDPSSETTIVTTHQTTRTEISAAARTEHNVVNEAAGWNCPSDETVCFCERAKLRNIDQREGVPRCDAKTLYVSRQYL